MALIGIILVVFLSGLLILFLWEERRTRTSTAAFGLLTSLWTGPERRCALRTHADVTVRYEIIANSQLPDHWGQATSQDLSESGMCVRAYERLGPRTHIKFEIQPQRSPTMIRGVGEVRWVQDEDRTGIRRTFLIGVQFIQLSQHDHNRLIHVLRKSRGRRRPTTQ